MCGVSRDRAVRSLSSPTAHSPDAWLPQTRNVGRSPTRTCPTAIRCPRWWGPHRRMTRQKQPRRPHWKLSHRGALVVGPERAQSASSVPQLLSICSITTAGLSTLLKPPSPPLPPPLRDCCTVLPPWPPQRPLARESAIITSDGQASRTAQRRRTCLELERLKPSSSQHHGIDRGRVAAGGALLENLCASIRDPQLCLGLGRQAVPLCRFYMPVCSAALTVDSLMTTGTSSATKRLRPGSDPPLEVEVLFPPRPRHTRQTHVAHPSRSNTGPLAVMAVQPRRKQCKRRKHRRHRKRRTRRKPMPPQPPRTGTDHQSCVECRTTHCDSSENSSCPSSLSPSQIQLADTLLGLLSSSDCLGNLERSLSLLVSSRLLGPTI